MKVDYFDNLIIPFKERHIERVLEIAGECHSSNWTYNDYIDEIKHPNSYGLICLGSEYTQTERISGFIISRLIKFQASIHQKKKDGIKQNQNVYQPVELMECEILNFAVRPVLQKQGIGQRLFDATVNECLKRKVESIWLEVRKDNHKAIVFYRKNNFEIAYTRKNYYRNPVQDALVLKLALKAEIFLAEANEETFG